jgi:hypothetical protein
VVAAVGDRVEADGGAGVVDHAPIPLDAPVTTAIRSAGIPTTSFIVVPGRPARE